MSYERTMLVLALSAILPAGATLYFGIFWRFFDYWRKHRLATYSLMLGTFIVLGAAVYLLRRFVFAYGVVCPSWSRASDGRFWQS